MMESPNGQRGTRGRFRAAALLVITFLAGLAAGYTVAGMRAPAPWGGERGRIRIMLPDSLPPAFEQLELTIVQRQQVLGILARARPTTDSILRGVIPRLRALTDSVDGEIRAVLRPEQRERLLTLRRATEPMLLLKTAPTAQSPARVDTIVTHAP